jgi:class 3 adenylate cyclase
MGASVPGDLTGRSIAFCAYDCAVRGLIMHATVYVAACIVAVFIWLMTIGSWSELDGYASNPSQAFTLDFWPIAIVVLWGTVLVIHAVAVLSRRASPRHRVRLEHRRERERERLTEKERASAEPARRRTSVMFTDIAGSTPLAQTLGDEAWAELLVEHRTMVRSRLSRHHGSEVGTQGDGFLVCFDESDDAVACAVDLQSRLDEQRRGGSFVPRLRIGIHAGDAMANDDDLIGRVVNLASRVVDAAEPDEVLVTEPVADNLTRPIVLHDRGLRRLKGITGPRHLLAVAWTDEPTTDEVVIVSDPAENPEIA